jgi:flavorubredoxin
MIAPSHGIVWRKDPKKIIDRYVRYANYLKGPAEEEICLIWGTMYGNTAKLIDTVEQTVRDSGLKLNQHQVPQTHYSYILSSAWKSTGLILAMPTYEYKMFPPMASVLDIFNRKHVQNKKVFRFGSFGWSGGAQRELDGMIKSLKWDCLEAYEFRGNPDENDRKQIQERTVQLIAKVREAVKAPA